MFDNKKGENNQEGEVKNTSGNNVRTAETGEEDGKQKVQDIFSEVEEGGGEKPTVFQPKEGTPANAVDSEQATANIKTPKIFVLIIIVFSLILLSVGGFWGYRFIVEKLMSGDIIGEDEHKPVAEEKEEINSLSNFSNEMETNKIIPEEKETGIKALKDKVFDNKSFKDSDGDGLSDEEERSLGMDINSVDTDNDNLFDREEVRVYRTDPLNPDTDGDGFLDGQEVEAGFNPKGAGKLFEIK